MDAADLGWLDATEAARLVAAGEITAVDRRRVAGRGAAGQPLVE